MEYFLAAHKSTTPAACYHGPKHVIMDQNLPKLFVSNKLFNYKGRSKEQERSSPELYSDHCEFLLRVLDDWGMETLKSKLHTIKKKNRPCSTLYGKTCQKLWIKKEFIKFYPWAASMVRPSVLYRKCRNK